MRVMRCALYQTDSVSWNAFYGDFFRMPHAQVVGELLNISLAKLFLDFTSREFTSIIADAEQAWVGIAAEPLSDQATVDQNQTFREKMDSRTSKYTPPKLQYVNFPQLPSLNGKWLHEYEKKDSRYS
jgi:hypothetical protein